MDKLKELQEEAKSDLAIISLEHLDQESYKNQLIKPKWLEYKTRFELLKTQSNIKHSRLYRDKWEYYTGKSPAEVYANKPFDLKVLKADVGIYIDADDEMQELGKKIEYVKTIVNYLERILREINNRNWNIKNTIAWKQFLHGE